LAAAARDSAAAPGRDEAPGQRRAGGEPVSAPSEWNVPLAAASAPAGPPPETWRVGIDPAPPAEFPPIPFPPVRAAGGAGSQDSADPPPSRSQRDDNRKRRVGGVIVGGIGEILITLGVLLGLYVVWQLFWTDVEANQEAAVMLEVVHRSPGWITPPAGSDQARLRDPATDPPPVDENPLATPSFGDSWATLHVPRWGADYNVPIVEGTDRVQILNKGLIGHYIGTEGPGRIGNFATSAHRTTYGKPYNRAAELEAGDSLIVETAQYYFVYKVYETDIVYPRDVQVINPVPQRGDDSWTSPGGQPYDSAEATKRIITMTTCHPMYSAAQRYIVWGELAYWADKSDGPLEELAAEG
jgi:sortase A